jgi:hypothetical protein
MASRIDHYSIEYCSGNATDPRIAYHYRNSTVRRFSNSGLNLTNRSHRSTITVHETVLTPPDQPKAKNKLVSF